MGVKEASRPAEFRDLVNRLQLVVSEIAEHLVEAERKALRQSVDQMAAAAQQKPLLTLDEVADRLGVSLSTVKNRVRSGELTSVKVGGLRRVRPVDLKEYVDSLPTTEPGDDTGSES